MSLQKIQQELKAPKNQFNSFGKYNYRSCEDILEGVKPLLDKYNMTLTISDEMIEVGGRVYVKATAELQDHETKDRITVHGCAREPEDRKGMDDSQITGATSSYARKYALNGLFCIDDTKDADTQDNRSQTTPQQKITKPNAPDAKVKELLKLIDDIFGDSGALKLKELTTFGDPGKEKWMDMDKLETYSEKWIDGAIKKVKEAADSEPF